MEDIFINIYTKYNIRKKINCDVFPKIISNTPTNRMQVNSLKIVGYILDREYYEINSRVNYENALKLVPGNAETVVYIGVQNMVGYYTDRKITSYTNRGNPRYSNIKKKTTITYSNLYCVKLTDKIKQKYSKIIGINRINDQNSKSEEKSIVEISPEKIIKETSKFTETYFKYRGLNVKRLNNTTIAIGKEYNMLLASSIEKMSINTRYFGLGMEAFNYLLSDLILNNLIIYGVFKKYQNILKFAKNRISNLVSIDVVECDIIIIEYLYREKTLTKTMINYLAYYKIIGHDYRKFQQGSKSIRNLIKEKDGDYHKFDDEIIDTLEVMIRDNIEQINKSSQMQSIFIEEMNVELNQLEDWYTDMKHSIIKSKRMSDTKKMSRIQSIDEDYMHYKTEINKRYLLSYDIIPNLVFIGKTKVLKLKSKIGKLDIAIIPKILNLLICSKCGGKKELLFEDTTNEILCINCGKFCEKNNEFYKIHEINMCHTCKKTYCYNHDLIACSGSHTSGEKYCFEDLKKCNTCDIELCSEHHISCDICNKTLCNFHAITELQKCNSCNKLFCEEHELSKCNTKYHNNYQFCSNCQQKCKVCNKIFCRKCLYSCSVNKTEKLCKDHVVRTKAVASSIYKKTCKVHSYYCINHKTHHPIGEKYAICAFNDDEKFCNQTSIKCNNCEKIICKKHKSKCGNCNQNLCIEEDIGKCVLHPDNPHCTSHQLNEVTLAGNLCIKTKTCEICSMKYILNDYKNVSNVQNISNNIFELFDIELYFINSNICKPCEQFKSHRYHTLKIKNSKIISKKDKIEFDEINDHLLSFGNGKYYILEYHNIIFIRKPKFLRGFKAIAFSIENGKIKSEYLPINEELRLEGKVKK